MNFDEIRSNNRSQNGDLIENFNNWKKISDFICSQGDDFRRSLRTLNEKKYKEYEGVFQTMMNLKPEWSVFKSQICKRIQSTNARKFTRSRRNGILSKDSQKFELATQESYMGKSSSKNLALNDFSKEALQSTAKQPALDERIITKVVSILKGRPQKFLKYCFHIKSNNFLEISERPRSETSEPDSSDSDTDSEYEEARYDYFTKFLKSNLKKNKNLDIHKKSTKSVDKYLKQKIPQFSPISKNSQVERSIRKIQSPRRISKPSLSDAEQRLAFTQRKS